MKHVLMHIKDRLLQEGIRIELESTGKFLTEKSMDDSDYDILMECMDKKPDILIMEVSGVQEKLSFQECMDAALEVRSSLPECKIVLIVHDNKEPLLIAKDVIDAKRNGMIDLFIYTSTGGDFMAAQIEALF